MQVRRIDGLCRRDRGRFVMFPFSLYRGCPEWVPPMVAGEMALLKRRHPFFEHSEADFFVAEEGKQVLGRIAVMENRNCNAYRGTESAFFGCFDAVQDREVAQALFDAAYQWARERGLTEMLGPRGWIGADATGVLVEGFEHRPALNVSYNYPYYDDLVRSAGLDPDTDHLSGYLPADYQLPSRFYELAAKVSARRGLRIKTFHTRAEMREWVPRVAEVHRRAFEGTHTFYPPTEREIQALAETIISVAEPGLIKLVLRGDEIVGFILAYRDLSAGLQRARGRVWPLGWAHLLWERRHATWVDVNGLGLLPEYQGLGGNVLLYTELSASVRAHGFRHVDVVMVDEHNSRSRADMEAIGVRWYKRHRCYRRAL